MTFLNRKCILPLGSLFVIIAGGIFANPLEPATPFDSLESYLQQAYRANPQLKAFEARYQAALSRIPQADSLPDPTLSITHFVESIQTRTGPQENVFMLSQRLPWFGKLKNRKSVASAEAEALWFAYQTQQLKLAEQVSLAYFEFGYTYQSVLSTRKSLQLLQDLETVVEEKVKTGGDLNALLRLKVETGKLSDKLQSLDQKLIVENARLNELLALPPQTELTPPVYALPQPIDLDPQSLSQSILSNNSELQMLKRKLASAEARRQIARLENYPDITLGLNYIETGKPTVNPTTPDAGNDPWSLTFSINIPLWQNKTRAIQAEALSEKRSIENEFEHRKNSLQADLRTSLALLADAHRRLELYGEELLDLAEQAVQNSNSAYQAGQAGIIDLIDSERSLLDIELLSSRAATDAWQQRIRIQTLANQPLTGITVDATPSYE